MTPYKEKRIKAYWMREYRARKAREKAERLKQKKPIEPDKQPEEKRIISAESQLEEYQQNFNYEESDKRSLVKAFRYWSRVAKDDSYSRSYRIEAEQKAEGFYNQLRQLVDNDSDALARLITGQSKWELDEEEGKHVEPEYNESFKQTQVEQQKKSYNEDIKHVEQVLEKRKFNEEERQRAEEANHS